LAAATMGVGDGGDRRQWWLVNVVADDSGGCWVLLQ